MTSSYLPNILVQIILSLLSFLVFWMQFIRYRKSHHLVLAIALPCTLLPYLIHSMSFFYGLGVVEFAAMILSCVLAFTVDKNKNPESDSQETVQEEMLHENCDS